MHKLWAVAIGLLASSAAWSEVRLPRLVADNMVLQRGQNITVWGWAEPGENVSLTFRDQRHQTVTRRNGRWFIPLGRFDAGGPYEMTVEGKNRIELHDVLVGDVWLAAGQSNMEVSVGPADSGWKGVINWDQELAGAYFPQVRLFKVHHRIALQPLTDAEADGWTPVTPQSAGGFSAVAYFFGRELHQRYHIPIGLIDSSWGSTMAEAWVSEASLKRFPEFGGSIDALKGINEAEAIAADRQYLKARADWYRSVGSQDRGRVGGADLWAAPDLPVAGWRAIDEPQMKAEEALGGFDGVLWFRKEIDIPPELAGKDLRLHLAYAYKAATTYFGGTKVGETQQGGEKPTPTDCLVPGKLVKAGRNVVVTRVTGEDGFVGLYTDAQSKLTAEIAGQEIPLAGRWLYRPGPDLSNLPRRSTYSKLNADPNAPTILFNGMIAPLTPYKIRGVIWYQGESNAIDKRSAQYRTLFPALILDWRKQWGYQFPFLFVQLAGWPPLSGTPPGESSFAELRDAQGMTLSLPATGMASAVDQPDDHPRDKQTVAHRLVLTAAKVAYGENIVDSGPVFESMQIEGSQIRLKFSSLGSGLTVRDRYGYARGFEVAGADEKFQPAQARQDGEDIVVGSTAVPKPTAVRYGWADTPDGNVANMEGLPALPFRTNGPKAPVPSHPSAAR